MLQISYVEGDSFVFVEFDAVMTENHEVMSTITSHAVERGADISDFKRPGQKHIRLEGLVTNTPLGAPPLSGLNSNASNVTVQTRAVPGAKDSRAVTQQFSEAFDRVKDMLAELTSLTENSVLLSIATDVATYEDVQLISMSAPRDSESGNAITFTIELVQIRIAETSTVDVPRPSQPRGRTRRNNGAQTTTQTNTSQTPPAPRDRRSAALQLAEGAAASDDTSTAAAGRFVLGLGGR